MSASLYSADKLLLLDVWSGKGPNTQFSGQTYNTLFSRASTMNRVCFPAHSFFFWLVLRSVMNNVLCNDENNYVIHQDTLWVENGRFFFKSHKKEMGNYNSNNGEHDIAF